MKKIIGFSVAMFLSSNFVHAADLDRNVNYSSDQLFMSIGLGYDMLSLKTSADTEKEFYEGTYMGVNGKVGMCAGDSINYCGALVGSYSWDQIEETSILLLEDFKADNTLTHFGGEFGMGVVTPTGVSFNPYIAVGYSWLTSDIDPKISTIAAKSELSGLTYGAGVDLIYDMGSDMFLAGNLKYLMGDLEGTYEVGTASTDLDSEELSVITGGISIGFNF